MPFSTLLLALVLAFRNGHDTQNMNERKDYDTITFLKDFDFSAGLLDSPGASGRSCRGLNHYQYSIYIVHAQTETGCLALHQHLAGERRLRFGVSQK